MKRFQLPRLPLGRIPWKRPDGPVAKRLLGCGVILGAVVGAFYLGKHGGRAEAQAQQPANQVVFPGNVGNLPPPSAEYARRVVAYIYGSIPITREELGEYLIERFGAERVDFLVNRRIIEMACRAKKIEVTNSEVDAQLAEDLKGFQCSAQEFNDKILRRYNKTLFEWREDVIRPKLALQRLVQDQITVNEDDIRKGFEAKFGDRVECRMIVLAREQNKDKYSIWERVSKSAEEFDNQATHQFIAPLAAEAGKIPLIHHHFSNANIEAEAFKLKPGEVSPLIGMEDGTTVILRCIQHHPAESQRSLEQERMGLYRELADMRLAQEIPKVFAGLRKDANPQIFLKREGIPHDATARTTPPAQGPQMSQMSPPAAPPAPPAPGTGQPLAPGIQPSGN
jgi:hypothetical protein